MYGILKSNKHSYKDFNLTIRTKSLSPPKKRKIKETVPYSNGSYDFSLIYGEQTYEERTLKYTFNLRAKSKEDLNIKKINILEWLYSGTKEKIIDDTIPGYYFFAEAEDIGFEEDGINATINVDFTAYPFKISNLHEGNDIWDIFNFELDYSQQVNFKVSGELDANLYNVGSNMQCPEVTCSSNIEVIRDNNTFNFKAGVSKDYRFLLNKGNNKLKLVGNGNIEFKYNKEVL